MAKARRQHRAPQPSRKATFDRGMAAVHAALYAPSLGQEQRVVLLRDLERSPYVHRQGDLPLSLAEPGT